MHVENFDFMKIVFDRISKKENGIYQYQKEKYCLHTGEIIPVSNHYLVTKYKGYDIITKYDFGNHNVGNVSCILPLDHQIPKFEITKKSFLSKFFNRKDNILNVSCENKEFTTFINKKVNDTKLENIANDTEFEPLIYLDCRAENDRIYSKFYLGFENKQYAISPMIRLYESIIDYNER